jgi:hypothetical protein
VDVGDDGQIGHNTLPRIGPKRSELNYALDNDGTVI